MFQDMAGCIVVIALAAVHYQLVSSRLRICLAEFIAGGLHTRFVVLVCFSISLSSYMQRVAYLVIPYPVPVTSTNLRRIEMVSACLVSDRIVRGQGACVAFLFGVGYC